MESLLATLGILVDKKIAAKIKSMSKENESPFPSRSRRKVQKNIQWTQRTGRYNKNKSTNQSTCRSAAKTEMPHPEIPHIVV
jgi:hypothetical protein